MVLSLVLSEFINVYLSSKSVSVSMVLSGPVGVADLLYLYIYKSEISYFRILATYRLDIRILPDCMIPGNPKRCDR